MDLENKPNLAKAIIAVMKDVKGIEKSMSVGTGQSSYQGVSDYDVKKSIGRSMAENGLALLPTGVEAKTTIERWEENSNYGVKQKQAVFTEATTTYLLLHESGESVTLAGYGHGVDSQDKGAGKATTYALKYALLYAFLVPTGKIDDADSTHSDDLEKEVGKITPAKSVLQLSKEFEQSKQVADKVKQAQTQAWLLKLDQTKIKDYAVGKGLEYTNAAEFVKDKSEEELKNFAEAVKGFSK